MALSAVSASGGAYCLLVFYGGRAVDLALLYGPRVVEQAATVAVSSAQAVTPFVTAAASKAFSSALWSAQLGCAALCAFWEWSQYSIRRHLAHYRLHRGMEPGKYVLISRAGEWDEV